MTTQYEAAKTYAKEAMRSCMVRLTQSEADTICSYLALAWTTGYGDAITACMSIADKHLAKMAPQDSAAGGQT